MSDPIPTPDQILAALCTPPRDMRDEIWLRTYVATFRHLRDHRGAVEAGRLAADEADFAVSYATVPAHRRAEVGLP